ncbi:MAG: ATP-dependent zinc protease [Pseudomonadales bacterium]|nr:ATP-dependent zinc protease [Pseudomonadales bacterium]
MTFSRLVVFISLFTVLSSCGLFSSSPAVVDTPIPTPTAKTKAKTCPSTVKTKQVIEIKKVIKTQLEVLGEIEYLTLKEKSLRMKARIDTGAQTTSIGVDSIQVFERDGDRWVKFTIKDRTSNKVVEFKRPYKRRAKIKQHEQKAVRRPVVEMTLTIGNITRKIDVTLNNRDNFKYPALIGRNFLDGKAAVDVSRRFMTLDDGH